MEKSISLNPSGVNMFIFSPCSRKAAHSVKACIFVLDSQVKCKHSHMTRGQNVEGKGSGGETSHHSVQRLDVPHLNGWRKKAPLSPKARQSQTTKLLVS